MHLCNVYCISLYVCLQYAGSAMLHGMTDLSDLLSDLFPFQVELSADKEDNHTHLDYTFLLFQLPCSADREDSVIDYISRLRRVQDKAADRLFIIPRIYTNKPRTTGKTASMASHMFCILFLTASIGQSSIVRYIIASLVIC